MAAKDKKVRLVSTAGTGYFYTTTNSSSEKKLNIKKYDPKAYDPKAGKKGMHVIFKQSKIK